MAEMGPSCLWVRHTTPGLPTSKVLNGKDRSVYLVENTSRGDLFASVSFLHFKNQSYLLQIPIQGFFANKKFKSSVFEKTHHLLM